MTAPRPRRVYIAGPMTRRAEFNFPAFILASRHLRSQGYDVFSPHEHDLSLGFDPAGMTGTENLAELGFDLRDFLQADLNWIAEHAEGIYLLHGSESSRGVAAEMALARALGLQAMHQGEEIWRPATDIEIASPLSEIELIRAFDSVRLGHLPDARWSRRGDLTLLRRDPSVAYLDRASAVEQILESEPGVDGHHPPLATPVPFPTADGEVRTVDPSTGAMKGMKPERFDLVPVEALAEVARLYGAGAQKYAAHNWRKGYAWSKSYAAMMRHATQFWAGQDQDPEMGTHHMANVAFHALALIVFHQEHPELDDRPHTHGFPRYGEDGSEQDAAA